MVDFPGGSAGQESTCNVGDLGSIPGLGRSPGEGKGCPLQYSGLENAIDQIIHGGRKESDMTERLSLPHSLTHMVGTERANFAEACAPWRRSPRTSCFVLCAVPAGRSVNACWLVEVQETNTVALSQFSEGLSKGLLVTRLTIMPCPCHQHDQRVELQAGGTLVITCLVRPFKRLLLGHLTWCQSKDGLTVVPLCPHFRHVTPRVFMRTQKWSLLLETQRPQGRYAPQCGGPKHGVCRAMHPSPWAWGCAPSMVGSCRHPCRTGVWTVWAQRVSAFLICSSQVVRFWVSILNSRLRLARPHWWFVNVSGWT